MSETTEQVATPAEAPMEQVEGTEGTPEATVPAEGTVPEALSNEPAITREELDSLDPTGLAGMVFDRLFATITAYNEKKTRLVQVGGDKAAYAASVIADANDADMVKFRDAIKTLSDQIAQLEAKRDEVVTAKFEQSREASKDEITTLETEAKTLESQIRDGRRGLLSMFNDETKAAVQSLLPKVSGTSNTGQRDGSRKLRGFEVKVNGEVALMKRQTDGKMVSTFSAAATKIGVTADVLQDAYFSAANLPKETKIEDLPTTPVEFTVSHGGKEYKVSAQRLTESAAA